MHTASIHATHVQIGDKMVRNPGGEVALWSILMILAGSYVSYTAFMEGKTALACVFAMMPVGCLLMWLNVRPAKWLVVFYLGIATFGAISMTAKNGISLPIPARGVAAAYFAIIFAKWKGSPSARFDEASLSPFTETPD